MQQPVSHQTSDSILALVAYDVSHYTLYLQVGACVLVDATLLDQSLTHYLITFAQCLRQNEISSLVDM